jgi:hypothetical protein
MNTYFRKYLRVTVIVLLGLATACVDKDFDLPDPLNIPQGEVYTIAALKQMFYDKGAQKISFNEDISITGVVTMDGASDNIYKNAFLEDATAAINIRLLSPGGLYQGDSIRINLKKTSINLYQNMLQIDSVHVGNNIIKLKTNVVVQPKETDILSLLNDASLQGRLVKLSNVEFHPADLGTTYADASNKVSQNKLLRDCNGSQIIVRTSGYATFANTTLAAGNGTIVGVLAQYNNDRQLYIRNINEVDLNGLRCSQQDNENLISLAEVRDLFNQGAKTIPVGKTIVGVITSDKNALNTASRNAYLQDGTGAVALRFSGNHTFNLGDRISIFAGSLEISDYNGLLQINNIPTGNASLSEIGISVEAQPVTIQQILANVKAYESRVVTIRNVTIAAGGTFAGDKTMNDGTGSISLFTRNEATFAANTVPTGSFTLTGIVSVFNTPNIIIRNMSDVQP